MKHPFDKCPSCSGKTLTWTVEAYPVNIPFGKTGSIDIDTYECYECNFKGTHTKGDPFRSYRNMHTCETVVPMISKLTEKFTVAYIEHVLDLPEDTVKGWEDYISETDLALLRCLSASPILLHLAQFNWDADAAGVNGPEGP